MLCAHALGFSKETFVEAADVLGARFTCVALDQRGHGETTVEDGGESFAAEAMADDIVAVLDHLEWPAAVLGGTSLGAATTLLAALRHPTRVRLLIQDLPGFAPASSRDVAGADQVAEALDRGDLVEAARRATSALPGSRSRPLASLLIDHWKRFGIVDLGPKLGRAFRSSARWRIVDRWPEDLAALAIPVHVLGLEGDPMHPIAIAKTMAETLPRARLWPRVPSLDPRAVARQWVQVALAEPPRRAR